jgi:hypothetical protein
MFPPLHTRRAQRARSAAPVPPLSRTVGGGGEAHGTSSAVSRCRPGSDRTHRRQVSARLVCFLFRQDPPNAAAAVPLSIETTLTPPDAVNPSTQPASRPPPPNSTASDCHAIHPFMTREGGGIGRCCCGIKITFQRSIRARPACQATLFVIVTSKPINN